MLERHFILDDADPVVFYGAQNANLRMIKSLFPKLRIVARGDVMHVIGEDDELERFDKAFVNLRGHCTDYNSLTAEDIVDIINGDKTGCQSGGDVIVYSTTGKPICPRSANQQALVRLFDTNDMLFACGPAGSGKTFLSIALAVRALKHKAVRRILLSRPAVEAGEKLGFLPGDMKEKIDPYLQPLYDALEEMVPAAKLQEYLDQRIIQIAPLAFMRGRTLNDAIVILDEAQNTTPSQIKMFLTRMGQGSKMIVTGDCSQIDLPPSQKSGLIEARRILEGVEGIGFVDFNQKDIVRHRLVSRIVHAYDCEAERQRQMKETARQQMAGNETPKHI